MNFVLFFFGLYAPFFCSGTFFKLTQMEILNSSWSTSKTQNKIRNDLECSSYCARTSGCSAFNFNQDSMTCELGDKRVARVAPSSTSATDKMKILATEDHLKLLVANGQTQTVEIVDLASPTTKCSKFPDYPLKVFGTVGGLLDQTTPMICGGQTPKTNQCYKYQAGAWLQTFPMVKPRVHFMGFSTSSDLDWPYRFLVVGSSNERSAEALTRTGWKMLNFNFPNYFYVSCMVTIDESTFLILGGEQSSITRSSNKTFIFNPSSGFLTPGPDLIIGRYGHSCGRIKTCDTSTSQSTIIGGGFNVNYLDSVEILDDLSGSWIAGPKLPGALQGSQMVEHPRGGVLMVIGKKIYLLPNAGTGSQWQLLPQTISITRVWFTAFLIPDKLADCS